MGYRSDQRKKFNFELQNILWFFYNGTKFAVENEFKWRKQPIFNASMIVNFNAIKLPEPYSSKDIWLISPKLDFTFTKTLFGQHLYNTIHKEKILELIQDYNGVLHHYLIYLLFIMIIISVLIISRQDIVVLT